MSLPSIVPCLSPRRSKWTADFHAGSSGLSRARRAGSPVRLHSPWWMAAGGWILTALLFTSAVRAEGSRTLYPASYPTSGGTCANAANRGCRANLDLQPGNYYVGKVNRRTFLYVYARAGEYVLLGSSNRSDGGDILVYAPTDFGTPGDETVPAVAAFSCASAAVPAGSYGGPGRGAIVTRAQELAGPHSADGSATVTGGFAPCAYRAPENGIYGVLFTATPSGPTNLNADIFNPRPSSNTVAAWDVTVRARADALADLNGRLFTYAWAGFAGVNNRPIFSRHYYVTRDGYRYSQALAGMDPNGFVLYGNSLGFLDNGQPLYKDIRGQDSYVTDLPQGVTSQRAEYPIFFSDIAPAGPNAAAVDAVLTALNIPTVPPTPSLVSATFTGHLPDPQRTTTGAGGTFQVTTKDATSYQIVVSRDGADFSPSNAANAVITGIAGSGEYSVLWSGNDAAGNLFPPQATPYLFRATARAGEIHLPMLDSENNGNGTSKATATFGGGPTITRLNGTGAGDTTVFFDDRGYVTRSGVLVGQLNGTLCPGAVPPGPSPAEALQGVDSTLAYGASARLYRWWLPGTNANSDCAPAGGWGDSKGLNLWTYYSVAPQTGTLTIDPIVRDAEAEVFVPGTALPGATVQGVLTFSNQGGSALSGVTYTVAAGTGCAAPALAFGNLPAGASASCSTVAGQGRYTLAGLPAALAPGQMVRGADPAAPLTLRYTAPASGPVAIVAAIATAQDPDDHPANNVARASTAIGTNDVQAGASAPASATPGSTVAGSLRFSNNGGTAASGWTWAVTIGTPASCPAGVAFTGLPAGVGLAGYDPATCAATFTGMPATLADGQFLQFAFRYTAPANGAVAVTATANAPGDADPANNRATATTRMAVIDMAVSLAGLPPAAILQGAYAGTFTCTNVGNTPAASGTRCAIDSGLPAGLAVQGCTLGPGAAPWVSGDAVPAGGVVTCRVAGVPAALGPSSLRASTAAVGDTVAADDTAVAILQVQEVQPVPSLSLGARWLLAALMAAAAAWLFGRSPVRPRH